MGRKRHGKQGPVAALWKPHSNVWSTMTNFAVRTP